MMPSRAKKVERAVAKLPSIPKELVDLFLTGPMTGEAINEAGVAFKKALIEASLNAELSHHLGYDPGAGRPELTTNQRNGSTAKTVLTGEGKLRIETPRDRDGSFEPLLVPKHARRFTGFDDKIVSLYARASGSTLSIPPGTSMTTATTAASVPNERIASPIDSSSVPLPPGCRAQAMIGRAAVAARSATRVSSGPGSRAAGQDAVASSPSMPARRMTPPRAPLRPAHWRRSQTE
jgi:hypothetical protein